MAVALPCMKCKGELWKIFVDTEKEELHFTCAKCGETVIIKKSGGIAS